MDATQPPTLTLADLDGLRALSDSHDGTEVTAALYVHATALLDAAEHRLLLDEIRRLTWDDRCHVVPVESAWFVRSGKGRAIGNGPTELGALRDAHRRLT
jgi:hypothetical protein